MGRYAAIKQSAKHEEKLDTRIRDIERDIGQLKTTQKDMGEWRSLVNHDFTHDNNTRWVANEDRWKKQDAETCDNHEFQIYVLRALHAILSDVADDAKAQTDKELYDYLVKRQRPAGEVK